MYIPNKACIFNSALHWPEVLFLGLTFPHWAGKLCVWMKLTALRMIDAVNLKQNHLQLCRDLVFRDRALHWAPDSANSNLLQAQDAAAYGTSLQEVAVV